MDMRNAPGAHWMPSCAADDGQKGLWEHLLPTTERSSSVYPYSLVCILLTRCHVLMQMAKTQKNKATSGHLGMLKVASPLGSPCSNEGFYKPLVPIF